MIIGTKPTPGDAALALATPEPQQYEAAGPFALPAPYVAMMFDDLATVEATTGLIDA